MCAMLVGRFGPPDVLEPVRLPTPPVGPGQVLLDVDLASITFVETQVRAGRAPNPALAPNLPYVPGNGVGGRVRQTGPGVDASLLGRRVVGSTGGTGGYAQAALLSTASLLDVPDALEMDQAVALLADGRTALALVQAASVQAGETVLVEAAAGGVGTLLVQLAREAGAQVVAAAGGPRKTALARQLGANLSVDYLASDWTDRIRAQVGAVDVVFDGVGGAIGRTAFELVRTGGRFCAFGMASGTWLPIPDAVGERRQVRLLRGAAAWGKVDLGELARRALVEAAEGRLRAVIGQRWRLDEAAQAHAAIEGRATLGKTLLVAGREAGECVAGGASQSE
jgi:NADPH2:quinone reductase